jgi:hypothetical protein
MDTTMEGREPPAGIDRKLKKFTHRPPKAPENVQGKIYVLAFV